MNSELTVGVSVDVEESPLMSPGLSSPDNVDLSDPNVLSKQLIEILNKKDPEECERALLKLKRGLALRSTYRDGVFLPVMV